MITKFFTLSILIFFLFNCPAKQEKENLDSKTITKYDDNRNKIEEKETKILPLGASRVDADGEYESYRYELWKLHQQNKDKVTFVGSEVDNKEYPKIGYVPFPNKHLGIGAISIKRLRQKLEDKINTFDKPDIVLFSSPGGNDFANGVPYNKIIIEIKTIIDILQNRNSNIIIIIEKMAPPAPKLVTPQYKFLEQTFFPHLNTIALEKTTDKSEVIIIDMVTGFNNETMLFDDVHYNEKGAKFIAQKYFNLIKNILQ